MSDVETEELRRRASVDGDSMEAYRRALCRKGEHEREADKFEQFAPVQPRDGVAEQALEAVRYMERREGEAHGRGASLIQTALLRAQREELMCQLVQAEQIRTMIAMPAFVVISGARCKHCETPLELAGMDLAQPRSAAV